MTEDILELIPIEERSKKEKWKRINDESYKDHYLISDLGRVFSIKKKKFVNPQKNSVKLYFKNTPKQIKIDYLISKTFTESIEEKKCIITKDKSPIIDLHIPLHEKGYIETWKEVPTSEEIFRKNYLVSDYGRIFSIRNKNISCGSKKNPYSITFQFNVDGVKKSYPVSRLVALAFLENKDNNKIVKHIDNNPENNHVSNLEWSTLTKSSIKSRKVIKMTKDDEFIQIYNSINEAGRSIIKPDESIKTIAKKIAKSCKDSSIFCDFKWKYENA